MSKTVTSVDAIQRLMATIVSGIVNGREWTIWVGNLRNYAENVETRLKVAPVSVTVSVPDGVDPVALSRLLVSLTASYLPKKVMIAANEYVTLSVTSSMLRDEPSRFTLEVDCPAVRK